MKKRALCAAMACMVLLGAGHVRAMDYTVPGYSHGGDVIDVTLPPGAGAANAKMTCVGEGGPAGGWEVACKYPLCYYVYSRGGIVCDFIDEAGTPDFSFHMCSPLAHNAEKQFCTTDAARITGATGDDMFRITNGAGGFFEYHRIDREREHSLKWIEWVSASGITQDAMIPSGPAGTFEDFTDFLENPPSFIQVKNACYPGTVKLCENPPAPRGGICGAAAGKLSYEAPPIAALCEIGAPSPVTTVLAGAVPTSWKWTCDPQRGGPVVSCSAPYGYSALVTMQVKYSHGDTAYKDSLGFYTVGSDGTIIAPTIPIPFANTGSAGTPLFTLPSVSAAELPRLGTFIISNGWHHNRAYARMDLTTPGNFNFVYNYGRADQRLAKITDPGAAVSLVYKDGRVISPVGNENHIYHEHVNLNRDNFNHIRRVDRGGGLVELQYEDLYGGGDQDFNDVIVQIGVH